MDLDNSGTKGIKVSFAFYAVVYKQNVQYIYVIYHYFDFKKFN